jgi:N-acetylglucosamine-6-sulfatase
VCCPSRSELLTGRYFHNLRDAASAATGGEIQSADDCMHINASMADFERSTFANALQQAGYRTGAFGKYLNSGGMGELCHAPVGRVPVGAPLQVPGGWTDFLGACPDTCYVNCTYNRNGVAASFTDPSFPRGSNYGTSVVGNASLDFVRASLDARKPFFAYVASHAPHGPATPAPWYAHLYKDAAAPRTPAWNVHSPDKHWVVATQPKITEDYAAKKIDAFYQNRLRSLRSVDDIVHDAYALLATHPANQLNNTCAFWSRSRSPRLWCRFFPSPRPPPPPLTRPPLPPPPSSPPPPPPPPRRLHLHE